ncbi:transcription factor DIVARICATA-like [Olea europaea subsp. europaea]|uniref:Transcription factor DIVARICATA-like n=1 Tax=Olea europaea subsp. europaea TaxID=158383 RepID=A0A8S0PAB3_OLEEU|nr:transcription factor DIVARICATA-like [Olea europaea subsp. europaea]
METLFQASFASNSGLLMQQRKTTVWTKEENKKFESALAVFDENTPNRWSMVASMIPGKSVYDVINQYKELVSDISDIEAGLVPVPVYLNSSFTLKLPDNHSFDVYRKRGRSYNQERKKGVPWTEEEHRRFLLGLQEHGKGDWRNISRNFVISKTPTQVASHAQKYYLRQLSGGKDKRRPSIHDITSVQLTKNCPSDNKKSPSSDNFSSVTFIQKSIGTPKMLLDWNHKNNGASMVFDSAYDDPFITYPREIASLGTCIVDTGAANRGFQFQFTGTFQSERSLE